jgi:hypothetical protein
MSVTERRVGERRNEPRTMPAPPADHEPVRENPEVMGRTEPRTTEPQTMEPRTTESQKRPEQMWPDMTEFQLRFQEIQSDFIDDPRSAIQKAERLMQEAIDRMAKSMQERVRAMHRDTDGKEDTEQLRVTMRLYREFIQSLGGSRAA